MKRYILAAIAVLVMMSGCEYHPYYDGQILRVYQAKYGLIEADGAHLNVPVADLGNVLIRNSLRVELGGEEVPEFVDREVREVCFFKRSVKPCRDRRGGHSEIFIIPRLGDHLGRQRHESRAGVGLSGFLYGVHFIVIYYRLAD